MATLRSEKVVEQWGTLVEGAAGRDKWLMDEMQKRIAEASPQQVSIKREAVSTGMFSGSREFLIITHATLREYVLFMGASNYGRDLAVYWYLTVNPGFLKRTISKQIASNPTALSQSIPVFAQQDLSSLVGSVHNRLKALIRELLDELSQDQTRVDWNPKGFLSIW
jgi:hypothetical protein